MSTAACTTTQPSLLDKPAPIAPVLADADGKGAIVLDTESGTVYGVQRSTRDRVWESQRAADRMYFGCVDACPSAFASGAFRIVSGPAPKDYTEWWSSNGAVRTERDRVKVVFTAPTSGPVTYEDDGVGAGMTFNARDGERARVALAAEPLLFQSRDDREVVVRTSPTSALHFVAVKGGWRTRRLSDVDLDLACVDSGRVLLGGNSSLSMDGTVVIRTESEQLGSCDLWGTFVLTASFSTSTNGGGKTRVELWHIDGTKLWGRDLRSLSVPALLSKGGDVALVDDDGLVVVSPNGQEVRRISGVVDVQATGDGTLVALFGDGEVKWL